MTQGHCIACDTPQEDIEAHKQRLHKGRAVLDAELYSGSIECKVCRNMVLTPRGQKWEQPPKHECNPAIPIKDPSGLVIRYMNANGMDASNFQLTLTPTEQ